MSCRQPLLIALSFFTVNSHWAAHASSAPAVVAVNFRAGSSKSSHNVARTVEAMGSQLAVDELSTIPARGPLIVRRAIGKRASVERASSEVEVASDDRFQPFFLSEENLSKNVKHVQASYPTAFRVASIIAVLGTVLAIGTCSTTQLAKIRRARSGDLRRLPPGMIPGKGPKGKLTMPPKPGDSNAVIWGGIPRDSGGAYPWHSMPSREALLTVGPTFHSNLYNVLPQCMTKRGLRRAGKGEVALVAMWNWPGERQRALVEMCLQDTLANKRALAEHLASHGLTGMAPPTFPSAAALRKALGQYNATTRLPRLLPEVRQGLWFLKHAGKDNNTGVTCYKGVEALLAHWEDPEFDDDPGRYIAQAEVRRPLLFPGVSGEMHKVTVRAYVLVLKNGRCFLHRELLVKSHPNPYDMEDPDPMRHVLCHVKYDGVVSTKGSDWEHYDAVWPRIGQMMIACFRSFDALSVLEDEDLDSGRALSVSFLLESMALRIRRFFRDSGLSDLVRRRRGIEEAVTMKYALLGLDVIVDEDLRPWLLELNRSPTLAPESRDPLGTRIKADVIEDFCQLIVDPILQSAEAAAKTIRGPRQGKGAPYAVKGAPWQGKGLPAAPPPEAMPAPRFAPAPDAGSGESSESSGHAGEAQPWPTQEWPAPHGSTQWSGLHTWASRLAAGEMDDSIHLPQIAPDVKSGARGFVELRQRAHIGVAAKGK